MLFFMLLVWYLFNIIFNFVNQDVTNSETLGLHAPFKAKYSMDNEMEDKICDFYDIYVQVLLL